MAPGIYMAGNRTCPICRGEKCRVTADGRRGFCKRSKKKWKLEMVTPEQAKRLRGGPIRHPNLPGWLLAMMRWSYGVVGRYLYPTLEQWELGFMRDTNIVGEVILWHGIAFAFITYHRRRGLPLRSDAEERQPVAGLSAMLSQAELPDTEDTRLIRQCLDSPDGWEAEEARTKQALEAGPCATWSPPEDMADWVR